jgi:hypothetical protein
MEGESGALLEWFGFGESIEFDVSMVAVEWTCGAGTNEFGLPISVVHSHLMLISSWFGDYDSIGLPRSRTGYSSHAVESTCDPGTTELGFSISIVATD